MSYRGPLLVLALTTLAISGCDTTREKSARAKLATERIVTSDKAVKIKRQNPDVSVVRVTLLREKRRSAFAVELRSKSSRTISDLPVLVGVQTSSGERKIVNAKAKTPYFQSHLAAIAPRSEAWFVVEPERRVPRGKPFAIVGTPSHRQLAGQKIPKVALTELVLGARRVTGKVTNESGFPQYSIQLYAVAEAKGAVVAAGAASVIKSGTGESQTFAISLIGRAPRGAAKVSALPVVLDPYK